MDLTGLLQWLLPFLSGVPALAPVVAIVGKVLGMSLGLAAVCTALVAFWHAVVGLLVALEKLFPVLHGVAEWAHAEEDKVGAIVNKAASILNELSILDIPSVKKQ